MLAGLALSHSRHKQMQMYNPSPERLLHSSIFFDLDGVWGEFSFAKQLNELIRVKAKNNKRFLGSMARNALSRTPPLGFFKDFVMEKDGKHRDSINTKRRGTAPVADLIRVHALAVGSTQRNSFSESGISSCCSSLSLPS